MDESEIQFMKSELGRGSKIVWRSCDGEVFEISRILDNYKEKWEEVSGPVAVFVRGGHADLLNTSLDEFYFMSSVTNYY